MSKVMEIEVDEVKVFTLTAADDGRLVFAGDVDESARLFFEKVVTLNNAKMKELEIIKTLLDFDIEVWKVDIGDNEEVGSMSKEQFQKCLENASLITPDNYLLLTLTMSL